MLDFVEVMSNTRSDKLGCSCCRLNYFVLSDCHMQACTPWWKYTTKEAFFVKFYFVKKLLFSQILGDFFYLSISGPSFSPYSNRVFFQSWKKVLVKDIMFKHLFFFSFNLSRPIKLIFWVGCGAKGCPYKLLNLPTFTERLIHL